MLVLVAALLRLLGCALVAAAGWSVSVPLGLLATGVATVAVTYLPDAA